MELESYREIKAYFLGKKAGITLYAWWKDGTQHVGTSGRLLGEARADLIRQENETLQALSEGKRVFTDNIRG